jgi:hypothetical protein
MDLCPLTRLVNAVPDVFQWILANVLWMESICPWYYMYLVILYIARRDTHRRLREENIITKDCSRRSKVRIVCAEFSSMVIYR